MRYNVMQNLSPDSPKKQYNPPILIVHGTVKDVTQAVGVHGSFDTGGSHFRIKTKP